jgi:antitoxin ParD1/3/4
MRRKENISHDAKLSPAWINKIVMQAREQQKQIDWLRAKLIKAEQSGFTNMRPDEILAQSKQELGI